MCCERGGGGRRLSALGWLPPGCAPAANGDRPGRGVSRRWRRLAAVPAGGAGEGGPAVGKGGMGSARTPRLRWARGGRGVAAQAVPQSI